MRGTVSPWIEWTTSAATCFVVLDREDRRPLRVQLEEQLRDGVRDGAPARRHRAAVDARAGGRARRRPRRGGRGLRAARGRGLPRGAPRIGHARGEGGARRRRRPPPRPSRACRPCASTCARSRPSAAPSRARPWLAAMRRALAAAPDADLGYGSWAGAPALRAVLAAYLGRARGVVAEPDDIVVTAGITQAIALLAGLLRARGRAPRARRGAGLLAAPHDPAARRARARARRRRRRRAAHRRAAARPRPRSSPPRTSSRPARCSRPSAARRCSTGPPRTTRS